MRDQIEHPDVSHASLARRNKGELRAIRRQGALIVIGGAVRQTLKAAAVRLDAIDVCGTGALRCERDPLSVWRERRVVVQTFDREPGVFVVAIRVREEDTHASRPGPAEGNPVWRSGCGGYCVPFRCEGCRTEQNQAGGERSLHDALRRTKTWMGCRYVAAESTVRQR